MIVNRNRESRNVLVALDIGTSKIVTLVAEVTPEGTLNLIGMGSHPSRGLKKGTVVNIESTVTAIQRSLEEAELMADVKIRDVITGIAGSHIKSFNSHGMVAIKDKEVSQYDIDRVIETARAVNIPMEQQVLHILEQEFIIDGQGGVRQPLGMSGMRLEVKVHIVTGAVSAAQNIMKCVRRCGLEVRDLMLQPLASADAVLLDDERDLGVCLVDIGGGTTDLAVFTEGAIKHTSVIPIAGDQITNDIAMALRTPTKDAEELKIRHGVALRQLASVNDMIEVPGVGDRGAREISRQTLAEVIEPRVEELYSLVQRELRSCGLEELLSSGIVITGGTSLMKGMVELGEEVFHMPVRVGLPQYSGALAEVVRNPRHSTGMGLLLAGLEQVKRDHHAKITGTGFKDVLEKMRNWFKGNFYGAVSRQAEAGNGRLACNRSHTQRRRQMIELLEAQSPEAVIKVVGIGGCGGNAVDHMINNGVQGVEFITMNTDAQALKRNLARTTLQLGTGVTKGLGAGANPEVGPPVRRGGPEPHRGAGERRRHALHHRGHGRRHGHGRRARGRVDRPRDGDPHGRRGHQAVRLRGQAPEGGRGRDRRAQAARRLPHHHSQRAPDAGAGRGRRPTRTPSAPPTTC